jgi:transcriptional regulator with XRE-family HTH domain
MANNPVDIYIGRRIRVRRTLLGMSQAALGNKLGLTFQQVQKYERGANRVSGSRFVQLAAALDVPVSYFFDEHDTRAAGDAEDAMQRRETLELARDYWRLSEGQRLAVRKIIRVMNADSADAFANPLPAAAE